MSINEHFEDKNLEPEFPSEIEIARESFSDSSEEQLDLDLSSKPLQEQGDEGSNETDTSPSYQEATSSIETEEDEENLDSDTEELEEEREDSNEEESENATKERQESNSERTKKAKKKASNDIPWLRNLLNTISLNNTQFSPKFALAMILLLVLAMISISLGYKTNAQRDRIDELEEQIELTYKKQQTLTSNIHRFMRRPEVLSKLKKLNIPLEPSDDVDYVIHSDDKD